MSISDLRERVRAELLEFAWSQWAQLGLSSHETRLDRWAIDPEALILFTVEVARRDPRLFDELLDWMSLNARLLSLQRLRNLSARFLPDPGLLDAVVAWMFESTPSIRWHVAKPQARRRGDSVPVFSKEVASFVGKADPVFESFGYLRPIAVRSGKSSEPDVRVPVSLAFRLRHLFGLGTRSEVMRILITFSDGPLDAARIADETRFAKRNINDALTGLVTSGVVKARWSKNKRVFSVFRDKWSNILEIAPKASRLPTFVSWTHLLPALLKLLIELEQIQEQDSEYMVSSRALKLVERIEKDLEVLDLTQTVGRRKPGGFPLRDFEELSDTLLRPIGSRRPQAQVSTSSLR